MKRTKILVLVFLWFLPVMGLTDPALTLSQAFELARKNNLEFQALQKEAGAAQGDLTQAGLTPNPSLDLEQTSSPFLGFQEGERSVFLSQEFELGGKRSARLSVAGDALEEARLRLADKERQLRMQVRVSFYAAWTAEQRLKILKEILDRQDKLLELNEARFEQGEIPGVEVNLIKAEYLRSQQKSDLAKGDAVTTLASFLQIIGLPPDEKPVLQLSNRALSPLSDQELLLSNALENRVDLRAQDKAIEHAQAQIRLQEALAFPDLTVGAGVVWDKLFIEGDEVTPAGVISQINREDQEYQIRFSLPLPLFNRNQGNIAKAKRLYEAELAKKQNLIRTVQTEVITAWEKVNEEEKIEERFEKELLPGVKENLQVVRKAYQLGGESIFAVIQAERTYSETQLDYLDNFLQLQKSIAFLESATGVELP